MRREPDLEYEELARYLKILSVPSRLVLLRKLQVPHAIADIHLKPSRRSRDKVEDRDISRSAVEFHLRALVDAGLVDESGAPPATTSLEYQTNGGRLFLVVDELRRVMLQRIGSAERTATSPDAPEVAPPELRGGRALVSVNGPREGEAFALEDGEEWTIGRDARADVRLLHDPFVSRQHARVLREGERLRIEPLPGSTNATQVDWREVPLGGAPLRSGAIVRIGRSLLVYREP